MIKNSYPSLPPDRLNFAIVEDITLQGAFDEAVVSNPPFNAVIHTASPVHLHSTDVKKDLLDPAINGTTGLLTSIKERAPTVRRVVITSSFAAMHDTALGHRPGHTYSEKDWNPVTMEQAVQDPITAYEASKTFAERSAWEFLERHSPQFGITTMCPPMVFGPLVQPVDLGYLGIGNGMILDFVRGRSTDKIPENFLFGWVDVRDVALCHVLAVENLGPAADQRFFLAAGRYSNRQVLQAIRSQFPEYHHLLPAESIPGGDYPDGGAYEVDSSKASQIFGIEWRSLQDTVRDTAISLK